MRRSRSSNAADRAAASGADSTVRAADRAAACADSADRADSVAADRAADDADRADRAADRAESAAERIDSAADHAANDAADRAADSADSAADSADSTDSRSTGASAPSLAASSTRPAAASASGAKTRTAASAQANARRSSRSGAAVPTSLGMYTLSRWRASSGSQSLRLRAYAAITGLVQLGRFDQGSPARALTASMSETPSEGEVWAPERRTKVSRSSVMRGASVLEPLHRTTAGPGPDSASDVGGGVVSAGALEGLVARATAPTRAWA